MADELDRIRRALETMRIEPDGARLTFVARLARENGWSPEHARRVDREYRRFLYLASTRGPATPSDAVDQAWHLHLGYTRHYWEEMCGRILGRPLHHEPTEGGPAADRRFRDQYEATLSAYRETFGGVPPADIWPAPARRFASKPVKVDKGRYWLIPRRGVKLAVGIGLGTLLVAACASASIGESVDSILLGAVILMGAVGIGSLALRRRSRNARDRDGGCGSTDFGCGNDFNSTSDSGSGDSGCGGGCGGGD